MRSWFAGSCLGIALTLALLNPLMCVLHCAMLDHHMADSGQMAQDVHCAMLHHHTMPAIALQALPDDLPSMGLTLQLPRAFYEMSMTIVVISMPLVLLHMFTPPAQLARHFLGRRPPGPPPKTQAY